MITTLILTAVMALLGPPMERPGDAGKLHSRAVTTQSAQHSSFSMPAISPPADREEIGKLETRLAVLEAGRNDLSAWATLFVGVVTLLVAANIGLSIWQVGSLARKEADAIIAEYNAQFSGFLTHGQQTIIERLAQYEESVSELSRRLDEIAEKIERYSTEASTASADLQREAAEGMVQLHNTAARLRGKLSPEGEEV
jgi:acetyl-CoA carboxylase carboxyltransferase component